MSLAKRKVKAALKKKGFDEERDKDHICFYHCWKSSGIRSGIWTRVSHGSRPKDLPKWLVSEMSRQMELQTKELKRFVDCGMSREEYEEIISEILKPKPT